MLLCRSSSRPAQRIDLRPTGLVIWPASKMTRALGDEFRLQSLEVLAGSPSHPGDRCSPVTLSSQHRQKAMRRREYFLVPCQGSRH